MYCVIILDFFLLLKEQQVEEETRLQENERRAALANERAKKSKALTSQALSNVSDPQVSFNS